MNLGPQLRRTLRDEAARAETSLNPDDIVRKARRRHRTVVIASSATATVVAMVALIVGLPTVLTPQEDAQRDVPAASGGGAEVDRADGTVPLHFDVRPANTRDGHDAEPHDSTTFFAMFRAVEKDPGNLQQAIRSPRPDMGYDSVRLRARNGTTGGFTATTHVTPGRYMVAIFAGTGVDTTPQGSYPTDPSLIFPESGDQQDAVFDVDGARDFTVRYHTGSGAADNSGEFSSDDPQTPPSGRAQEFTLADKSVSSPDRDNLPATLTDVSARVLDEVDHVRLQFPDNDGVPAVRVGYEHRPIRYVGSDRPVNLAGEGPVLRVTLSNVNRTYAAAGSLLDRPTGRTDVTEVKNLGFSAGQLTLGIGFEAGQEPKGFKVFRGADAIMIEILR